MMMRCQVEIHVLLIIYIVRCKYSEYLTVKQESGCFFIRFFLPRDRGTVSWRMVCPAIFP